MKIIYSDNVKNLAKECSKLSYLADKYELRNVALPLRPNKPNVPRFAPWYFITIILPILFVFMVVFHVYLHLKYIKSLNHYNNLLIKWELDKDKIIFENLRNKNALSILYDSAMIDSEEFNNYRTSKIMKHLKLQPETTDSIEDARKFGYVTKYEDTLYAKLSQKIRIVRQVFTPTGHSVDFIAFNLYKNTAWAIEVDGSYHSTAKMIEKDRLREAVLLNNGINIIRISNSEITSDIDSIVAEIQRIMDSVF
ncbi:endonuclease domain-containing protein [Geomonas propionica]|uniref:DUF559 domain-containing protein n=1 Tax=Geomonas propionica TaxID=2798582 RepID=A0ABS0YPQ7_9BACT|nr:DUF559 domain-containing protein [Geomonas propionica]MBJ6799868.1 DUF559 domain-containing protein [Geomonas propionica]